MRSGLPICGPPQRPRKNAGFTLAELVVASTILTVVMAAIYTAFGNTLRVWRLGEAHLDTYQDARTAFNTLSRELECVVGGSELLFQGKDDEFECYVVGQPMDVGENEGARVLWVRYRYNRGGNTLIREEAVVKSALTVTPPDEDALNPDAEKHRIKLGRKRKFEIARSVEAFKVRYYWIPPVERPKDEPPQWVEPIVLDESREGWGLPQGIEVSLKLEDPNVDTGSTTFTFRKAFRCPTTPYNEKRMGEAKM